MTTKHALISLILPAIFAASAAAQSPSLLERFDRVDRNRDGKVTPQELPQPELFQRLDRTRDGVIERSEIGGAAAPNRPRSAGTGDLAMPAEPPHKKHLNLRYAEIAGVDPNLMSLDLYVPDDKRASAKRPVMIMIHGGGWRKGDKASPAIVGSKMRHFVGAGYIYATINYRLSPERPEEGGVRHPVHARDCAKAIAWIHDHIGEYGGDPQRLNLMGHSAGGHLAGIVGTNERFLQEQGKDLSILKSNVLLDPAALDIPRYVEMAEGRAVTAMYELAFGKDEADWRDASPQLHVAPGKHIPPMLVFYAGDRMNLDVLAPAFVEALTKAGSPSRAVDTVTLDHGQINSHIGMIDEPMTALIMRLHASDDASKFAARLGGETTESTAQAIPSKNANPAPKPAPATAKPAPAASPPVDGRPVLKELPDSDAVRDAAGTGQLFECVHVPGITDVREGMNGFALADLNRDGRPDVIATFSPPSSYRGTRLAVLINGGGFRFTPHALAIGNAGSMDDFGGAAQIPNLADFNGDGFLDLLVTRSAPMLGGKVRGGLKPLGVAFLLSDGAWDRFEDVSEGMGARNELGYNRQTSIGDVNGDGWLDLAIGCDNIKNGLGGFPHSRLYIFQPRSRTRQSLAATRQDAERFADGSYVDIGGTDLVPDFGGFYHDSAKDKAGPGISLRDLDNDGDLDLLQSYHVDVRQPLLPYWPGEYRQGVFCWKNLLREMGELRFKKITGNGLHCEARLKYNREKQLYEPASDARAPGLPYISLADVDGDGLQDVFAVGPDSDYWAPRVEHVTGRFWRNLGGFRFEDRTGPAGFAPLNNTYGDWMDFFLEQRPARWANWKPVATFESQPGLTPQHPSMNTPYFADAVFGDFNNDGALDVVVMNRSESNVARAMLFMGKGDGAFEVKPTTFSGLDSSGISAEAADLDGDGLLDLVFAADPDNSLAPGQVVAPERYESKVYWNTGEHGAKQNRWLHLTFTGLKDAELIGARVEVNAAGKKQYRWIHSNHSYKSGGALDAHFGLGRAASADLKVTLPSGKAVTFAGVTAGQFFDLNLTTRQANQVKP